MAVKARGDSWQAVFNFKGKRYRRQFPTKLEARKWEAESLGRLEEGKEPELATLGRPASQSGEKAPETIAELRDWVWATRWSHLTSGDVMKEAADQLVDLIGADKPVKVLDKATIGRVVIALQKTGNKPRTINRKMSTLNVMADEAMALYEGLKLARHTPFATAEGRIRRLSADEEKAATGYFEADGDQDMLDFFYVALDTGLRKTENITLDLDRTGNPAFVQVYGIGAKGKKGRAVPTTERVVEIIARRRKVAEGGRLFPKLNRDSVLYRWRLMRKELKLVSDPDFVPHILRHEFCSRLADLGIAAQIIQRLAGHADITTTMRYIHLSPVTLASAIERMSGAYQTVSQGVANACHGAENDYFNSLPQAAITA
ncbi:site-specific integrase [Labrys neptuniae]